MTTSCADKKAAPPYQNILAIQSVLKGGLVAFMCDDLEEYFTAERHSPEAAQEFLDRRKERNRIEAENPPPIQAVPLPKPTLPPLALNETMEFMQEVARNGVLLGLDENKILIADGWGSILETWELNILKRQGPITNTLFQIRSTHGKTDPLNIEKLTGDFYFDQERLRLNELQDSVGIFKAVSIYEAEKKANLMRCTFPNEPADSGAAILPEIKNETIVSRYYNLQTVSDFSKMLTTQYRVKHIFPREGLSAIFGPPGSAKTFMALGLAFSISDGLEWFGYRVEPCDVLYVCLEGQGGLPQRIQAYCRHQGEGSGKRLRFITQPFSLLYHDDTGALIRTIRETGIHAGVIVIDTLSAASPGADENSSADMGRVLQATKCIREECGGLGILVHHSGKDASKGLRGHSSLAAALDSVIHVTRNDAQRSWELAKAKDGLDGKEHPFQLSIVDLGIDEDGDPITSCVIVPKERAVDGVRRVKVPSSGNQKVVYEVAGELLRLGKNWGKGGAPTTRPCIRVDELISACHGRLAVESHRVTERTRVAIISLVSKGCLILREDWLWVP